VSRQVRLSIKSTLEAVPLVGAAVRGLCDFAGLPEHDTCWIELCAVEAANNAIEHAYRSEVGREVEVVFTVHEDRIQLDVSDWGMIMDPGVLRAARVRPIEIDPEDIGNMPVGGRGLGIITRMMDVVHYASADGKNTLSMVRYFATARTAP
jgi:anti-sigma regulatory factor (Ser/Thr protein kinase)